MKSKVALIECYSYEDSEVQDAVEKGVALMGGWQRFVTKNEKILLKPNLLAKTEPAKACTTHPAVFRAVGATLQKEGHTDLWYGDSSGNHLMGLEKVAAGCGIKQVADALAIKAANFSEGKEIAYPQGYAAKEFIICNGILETDAIISLSKMKTHMLERITGAVKNTFGSVYGFNKGAAHVKFPDSDSFGRMLVDLNGLIKPRLHIMDAIVAMEGNGPQSGTPISMNLILISTDPVALDSVFCRLVNLEPHLVPTNFYGQQYGVGTMDDKGIEILTADGMTVSVAEAAERWGNADFDIPRNAESVGRIKMMQPFMKFLEKRPVIEKRKCVGCGICVNSCPVSEKAVFFAEGKKATAANGKKIPVYDYKKCIRCYCCQEMCPESAIVVKSPVLTKVLDRNWKI